MKSIKFFSVLTMAAFMLITFHVNAQRVERHPKEKVIVVKKRHHIFRRTVVYHPVWGPRLAYRHRWVYFPRYNFYWDNFHNVFVVRTGAVWVVTDVRPKVVERIDLSKEKSVELKEDNDSTDSIQDKNSEHIDKYKAE